MRLPDGSVGYILNLPFPSRQPVNLNENINLPLDDYSNNSSSTSVEQRITILEKTCERIESKIDNQNETISKILFFMANMEKLLSLQGKKSAEQPKDLLLVQRNDHCKNLNDLINLEKQLGDMDYKTQFFNYYKSQYDLTGKRDGSMIFRTVTRKIIDPTIMLDFSWKGQQRNNTQENDNENSSDKNKSFKATFPNFISAITMICSAADVNFSNEKTEEEFNKMLRFKKVIAKRASKPQTESKSSSRVKKKKTSKILKSDHEEIRDENAMGNETEKIEDEIGNMREN